MIILKFFASIFLLFIALLVLFIVISFLLASNFINSINKPQKQQKDNTEIPTAIECKKCGTFYAQMPEDGKCSCGAKL